MTRVLFVCLGNICRSPLAEAAFRKAAESAGLDIEVDSAGTADYHVGDPPDPRTIAEAARHGIDIGHYRGRQLQAADFHTFDYILGMDRQNMANIARVDPGNGKAQVALLLELIDRSDGVEVSDPWYGDEDSFRFTWKIVDAAAAELVEHLRGSAAA
jgi:protein-tyrosine phosphatase